MNKQRIPAPIAIVGFGLRMPGDLADGPAFWNALIEGRDLVTEIGPQRWATDALQHPKRAEPGRSITFAAGVLSDIDTFDAGFFGISPREAALIDPQQRLLLEMAWEAFEDAGIPPATVRGSDAAVYIGISGLDYGMRVIDDLSSMTGHTMTGNTMSIAANRLSYVFDLHGPSLAVDTACSSSLVALHHACTALAAGEAPLALAGGVNMLLHPYPFVGFTKASMLSASGRCKAFAADGDGYVRAEGGAVLVLKRLDDAVRDGNRVHAVIRASGVNADGGRKNGLTIPSGAAQIELMRRVLAQSGLRPDDVDYIEAHGTGTRIGDPIEAAAIGAVYGDGRARPLPIGSVKSNVGHLEPASGMAGLAKAMLVLRHGVVPPSLHTQVLNPAIDFDALALRVAREPVTLAAAGRPLRVGLNSFGFGGVNAHVILEQAPTHRAAPTAASARTPLVISAADVGALRALSRSYADAIEHGADRAALAQAAWERRDWLAERLALPDVDATTPHTLRAFADGRDNGGLVHEHSLGGAAPAALVFSGNGSQWTGMGRRCMQESPAFARAVAEVDAHVRAAGGPDLLAALASDDPAVLQDTAVAQPALFALQVAATEALRALGLRADAATGHSVGEIAAAWAVGALDLPQAAKVIVARSRAQALTRGTGRMAAAGLPAGDMQQRLHELGLAGRIAVAADNSPRSCTVSGDADALRELRAALRQHGLFYHELDIDYAFHSPAMDPVRSQLLAELDSLAPRPGSGRFFSTVTGAELEGSALDAAYWWHNVRDPVRFCAAVAALRRAGCRVFIEVGPNAILQRYIGETLDAERLDGRALAHAPRQKDGFTDIVDTVLRAALLGAEVDARAHFATPLRGPVDLPRYPWQHQRHWYASTTESYRLIQRDWVHPLLGYRLKDLPAAWESHLDARKTPWLAYHRIGGAVVLPGAAYAELALAASREWFGGAAFVIDGLDIVSPVVFDGEHARTLRVLLDTEDLRLRIESRQRLSDDAWTLHARCKLAGPVPAQLRHAALPVPGAHATRVDADTLYAAAAALGLDYGPVFRRLARVDTLGPALRAELDAAASVEAEFLLHPALLDQCFQAIIGFLCEQPGNTMSYLPVGIGRLSLLAPADATTTLVGRMLRRGPRSLLVDFELRDAQGRLLVVASGCRFRAAALAPAAHPPASWAQVARLSPLESPGQPALPATATLARIIAQRWASDPEQRRQHYLNEVAPLLELLPLAYARDALRAAGHLDAALLAHWRGAHPLLRWLLDELTAQGMLRESGASCQLDDGDLPSSAEIWSSALAACPAAAPELLRIGRVGLHLAALTRPEPGDTAVPTPPDLQTPSYAGTRAALVAALQALAARWPRDRRLRVLEFGHGDSVLADHLDTLAPDVALDLVLARHEADDLGALRAVFSGHATVSVVGIDPDGVDLDATTPLPAHFDVVVLDHTLHRFAQPAQTLGALLPRLSSDAMLLLAERHPDHAATFGDGAAPGWWHAQTDGTPHPALLAPSDWESALQHLGWTDVQTLADPAANGMPLGGFVLLARPANGIIEASPRPVARWALMVGDGAHDDLADALASRLRAADQTVQRLTTGAASAAATVEPQHWVLFPAPADARAPAAVVARACDALRRCLLDIVRRTPGATVHLVLPGGAPIAATPSPAAAALWGLARVAANELHPLTLRLIDPETDPDALLAECLAGDAETELAWVHGRRHAPRLLPHADAAAAQRASAWRLDFTLAGQLRNLHWSACDRPGPGPGEVEIEARAAGLNFRDVMYAMGLLADEALEQGFAGPTLGLEVAGVISRCGPGAQRFKPGDAVLAFAGASFASHVVVPERAVASKPAAWTFAEAATVPTVFFTVWYALTEIARLQPGERILVHGAAGGVGIAAIQVASLLGAEVIASAGSTSKRDFVRLLGASHVIDSRDPQFDEAVLALTGGEGVDVVLNSLSGEAIARNLRAIRPFGRFVELGKRDFYEDTRIGLRPFRNNVSYFGVDADQLMQLRPELATRMFTEVMARFADGTLHPLPHRVFAADRVVDAFRHMQQARQIGKVVIDLAHPPHGINTAPPPTHWTAAADATYIVAGGLGGFGLATATWLVERGARHLALLGRRGADTPGVTPALQALRAHGADVRAIACDITERADLARALAALRTTMPPVRGVLHTAMVLDDALLPNLDASRFAAVLAPKLDGAWNLHDLTMDDPLDLFVLYSSATTFLGNPGQANYVAANAALEALARHRRSHRQPPPPRGGGAQRGGGGGPPQPPPPAPPRPRPPPAPPRPPAGRGGPGGPPRPCPPPPWPGGPSATLACSPTTPPRATPCTCASAPTRCARTPRCNGSSACWPTTPRAWPSWTSTGPCCNAACRPPAAPCSMNCGGACPPAPPTPAATTCASNSPA